MGKTKTKRKRKSKEREEEIEEGVIGLLTWGYEEWYEQKRE